MYYFITPFLTLFMTHFQFCFFLLHLMVWSINLLNHFACPFLLSLFPDKKVRLAKWFHNLKVIKSYNKSRKRAGNLWSYYFISKWSVLSRTVLMMMNRYWIVFENWLTDVSIISSRVIVRASYHHKSPTLGKHDLNLRKI